MSSLNHQSISYKTQERINELFEETQELYISESGMRDELNSDELIEDYLYSFDFNARVNIVIDSLQRELACSRMTIKHLNSK